MVMVEHYAVEIKTVEREIFKGISYQEPNIGDSSIKLWSIENNRESLEIASSAILWVKVTPVEAL